MINYFIQIVRAAGVDDPVINPIKVTMDYKDVMKHVVDIIGPVAGAVAFIYLIYSGFLYLTAAGNLDNAKKGQQGIINAIIGIVIIVLAWTIITLVSNTANKIAFL